MDQPRPATLVSPTFEEKRQAAIAYLGTRYVNHPEYHFIPRHSANPATYMAARIPYLMSVSRSAEEQRRHNPVSLESKHASHA